MMEEGSRLRAEGWLPFDLVLDQPAESDLVDVFLKCKACQRFTTAGWRFRDAMGDGRWAMVLFSYGITVGRRGDCMGKGLRGCSFTGVWGLGAGLSSMARVRGHAAVSWFFSRLPTIPIMTPEVENI
jgi:hypothetical protein